MVKLPFNINKEQLNEFVYSNKPITITQFTAKINALIDTDVYKKLTPKRVTDWLLNNRLLRLICIFGNRSKAPTKYGESCGIHAESRIGVAKLHVVNTYDIDAQKFLIENMQNIVNNKPIKVPQQYLR